MTMEQLLPFLVFAEAFALSTIGVFVLVTAYCLFRFTQLKKELL